MPRRHPALPPALTDVLQPPLKRARVQQQSCVTSKNKAILHTLFSIKLVSDVMQTPSKPTTPFAKSPNRPARLLHFENRSPQPSPSSWWFGTPKTSPAFRVDKMHYNKLEDVPAPTTPERLLSLPLSSRSSPVVVCEPVKKVIEDEEHGHADSRASSPFDSEPEDEHDDHTPPESPLSYKVASLSPVRELLEAQTYTEVKPESTPSIEETDGESKIINLDEEDRMISAIPETQQDGSFTPPTTLLDEDDTVSTSPIQIKPLEPVQISPTHNETTEDENEDALDDRRDSFEPLQPLKPEIENKVVEYQEQSVPADEEKLKEDEDTEEVTTIEWQEPEDVHGTKEDDHDGNDRNVHTPSATSTTVSPLPPSDSSVADVQEYSTDVKAALDSQVNEANASPTGEDEQGREVSQIEKSWISIPEHVQGIDGIGDEVTQSMHNDEAGEQLPGGDKIEDHDTQSDSSLDHLPIPTDTSVLDIMSKYKLQGTASTTPSRMYFEPVLSDIDLVSLGKQAEYDRLHDRLHDDANEDHASMKQAPPSLPSPAAWWELTLIPAWTPSPDVLGSKASDKHDTHPEDHKPRRRSWRERTRGKSCIPRNQLRPSQRGPPRAATALSPEQRAAGSKWASLATNIEDHDAQLAQAAVRAAEAKRAADGNSTGEYKPVFRETFKKTEAGEALGSRRVVEIVETVHGANTNSAVSEPQSPDETKIKKEKDAGKNDALDNKLELAPIVSGTSATPPIFSDTTITDDKLESFLADRRHSGVQFGTSLADNQLENVRAYRRASLNDHIDTFSKGKEIEYNPLTQHQQEPAKFDHFTGAIPLPHDHTSFILPPVNAPVLPESEYDPWPAGLEAKVLQRVMSPDRHASPAPTSELAIDTSTARSSSFGSSGSLTPLSARSIRDRRQKAPAQPKLKDALLRPARRNSWSGDENDEDDEDELNDEDDDSEEWTEDSPARSISTRFAGQDTPILQNAPLDILAAGGSSVAQSDEAQAEKNKSGIGSVLDRLYHIIFYPLIMLCAAYSSVGRKIDRALDHTTGFLSGSGPKVAREGDEDVGETSALLRVGRCGGFGAAGHAEQSVGVEEDISSDEEGDEIGERDGLWVRGARSAAKSVVQGLKEGEKVEEVAVEEEGEEGNEEEELEQDIGETWWI